ncbi:hypothetical protein [Promicromonospora sp. AC04]|uniref:hypothetical protein n=1 Tax=Promicromonospora sp. AC04 TaxID=2135723 RepID=UPI000D33B9E5|nr:hypothetical protein [Promicromonospora sp. AC04]
MIEHPMAGQIPVERKPLYRRVWFWIVLGVLVLPVLGFGAMVVWFLTTGGWSAPEPESVDCAEAMRSAGFETLPVPTGTGTDGTGSGATCAGGGFQDPFVTINFVAPQDDVDAWLRAELPETELQAEPCVDVDACLQVSYGEPDAPESGWNLDVSTTDQGDGKVAVAIMAFSM